MAKCEYCGANQATWKCTGCEQLICDDCKRRSEPCKPHTEYVRIHPEPKLEVFITVEGGVATVDKCPDNVVVHIHDLDVAYCEDCGSNDDLLVCNSCGAITCEECKTSDDHGHTWARVEM